MNQGSLKYEEVKNIFEESEHRFGELFVEITAIEEGLELLKTERIELEAAVKNAGGIMIQTGQSV